MKTFQWITFNCLIFLLIAIVSADSQLFSVLALATLAKVLRPRPKYRPPVYYDPMVPGNSYGSPTIMRPPPMPQLIPQPISQSVPQSIPQFVPQSIKIPTISSKRGFGYPNINTSPKISTNQVWTQNQQNFAKSPTINNFAPSQPTISFQAKPDNGPSIMSNSILTQKPQLYPVFKFVGTKKQPKSKVKKG